MDLSRLAREHGDQPAVIMAGSGVTLSYAELNLQSNKIAQLFRSRGLHPGDHIAVLMENRPEFFPTVWAAQRSGLFYTPVNWHLSGTEAACLWTATGRFRVPSRAARPRAPSPGSRRAAGIRGASLGDAVVDGWPPAG